MRSTSVRFIFLWTSLLLLVPSALAADEGWRIRFYAQAGHAQQPLMEERAEWLWWPGYSVERSTDVTPYGAGIEVSNGVSPEWSFGVRLGYDRAPAEWADPDEPAWYRIEQQSNIGEILLIGHRSLCHSCSRVKPFMKGGVGAGYTRTSLLFEWLLPGNPRYEYARGQSEGWFPIATAGLGLSGPLVGDRWSWEVGAGYMWGRHNEHVPAEGSLNFPGEEGSTIETETDLTGPSVWMGVGMSF